MKTLMRLKWRMCLQSRLEDQSLKIKGNLERLLGRAANVIKFGFPSAMHPGESCLTLVNSKAVWTQFCLLLVTALA